MPTSIPYDHPSLVLGNVVDTRVLALLHKVARLQNSIDAAQDKLNSHVSLKRSLTMTISELMGLGVDISDITNKIKKIDTSITNAAKSYLDVRLSNEDSILNLRDQIANLELQDGIESPIDFGKSAIKSLPLSSESLKLDAQYFSYEKRDNKAVDILSNIENYVKESTEGLGSKSGKLAKAASAQVYQQQQNHELSGTLIITASCTHKNVALVEPLYIDVDKVIESWNAGSLKTIIRPDEKSMKALNNNNAKNQESISVISAVSYGSSFIGMVHVLKNEASTTNPSEEVIRNLQEKIKLGGWLENATGGFGVEPSVLNDIKRALNAHSINSHISLIVMGAVPSIASNKLMSGIKELSKPDISKIQKSITAVSSSAEKELETLETGNEKSKAFKRLNRLVNGKEESLLTGLGTIDIKNNNIMDINSLMTAFENYLIAIKEKKDFVGTPINFYLKKITPQYISKLWIDKYYPEKNTKTTDIDTK